ncbi:MAG: ISL3 family transposase, partial [Lentisphaeria bacterium]
MNNDIFQISQKIYSYQVLSHEIINNICIFEVIRKPGLFNCPKCQSKKVSKAKEKHRFINGLKYGILDVVIKVQMHRLRCHECKAICTEVLDFIPQQKCHYTKALANEILKLCKHLPLKRVAEYTNLHWGTVKEIEKNYLREKYKQVDLRNVTCIGIDEVFLGKGLGYATIVRDLESGNTLNVTPGRNAASLADFQAKLTEQGAEIDVVAIDLGNSFSSWVKKFHPNAVITYDHFHVIKLMNERLNEQRNRTLKQLNNDDKELLKGSRFLWLKNVEDLKDEDHDRLMNLKKTFKDLGNVSMMKEALRNIYNICKNETEARICFDSWCRIANKINLPSLKQMAKTVNSKLEGILTHWWTRVTSVAMEGFNNKIGALQRRSYGFK